MLYFVKTPQVIKRIFANLTWDVPTDEKVLYLTFDDGPTTEITHWVLSELDKHKAKATFFCIGKNVINHPSIFQDIIKKGHAIGNHTHNHLNGWKKTSNVYIENINKAQQTIATEIEKNPQVFPQSKISCQKYLIKNLFRPPYGKIKNSVAKKLLKKGYKIIMWDVLSGDFDQSLTREKCLNNVLNNASKGSIVVFHDSVKAFDNLKFVLPKVLDHFSEKGFVFNVIE